MDELIGKAAEGQFKDIIEVCGEYFFVGDEKEVWSLITFIVYGVSLHDSILKKLSVPRNFHLYIVCAYLTVLMTYFGVNMILPGMHSYSGM